VGFIQKQYLKLVLQNIPKYNTRTILVNKEEEIHFYEAASQISKFSNMQASQFTLEGVQIDKSLAMLSVD